MIVAVLGSASLPGSSHTAVAGDVRGDSRVGGGVEPNTAPVLPVSRELGLTIAAAHVAWARRHQPWLLEEWLDA